MNLSLVPIYRSAVEDDHPPLRLHDLRSFSLHRMVQWKLAGEQSQNPVFFAFHFAAGSPVQISMTDQMKNTMNNVADQFGWPGSAEAASLTYRLIDTDENFAM
jgi:hypothetical protein